MNFDKTYDMLNDVRERLESSIPNSSVNLIPSDTDDFFITVKQRNNTTGDESKWSFCVDFGNNKVQMLEPVEDEESFGNENEVFRIIKNFLNGGVSREKRRSRLDYDPSKPIKITGKGNKIGSSRKPIKSVNETVKYDYRFFYDKLKESPYFDEYVVRYDDDVGDDNIHTKKDIPVRVTYPNGEMKDYPNCWVQFWRGGWQFTIRNNIGGKGRYSEITDASVDNDKIVIRDKDGYTLEFNLSGNGINSSRRIVKSSINELNNSDITEGMRVTWGGGRKGKVILWNKNNVLIQNLGGEQDYIIGHNYKLSGTAKEPKLSWGHGDYGWLDKDEAIEAFKENW